MNKTDPPKTFGVFKPVDHTVISFRSDADMHTAMSSLTEQGFPVSSLVCYTPAEMMIQVDAELKTASPLASFGYELDLIKAHRELAESGCSFLMVYAPDDKQAQRVAAVVRASEAVTAQHYGTFMIEEIMEVQPGGGGAHQTSGNEPPDNEDSDDAPISPR